MEPSSTNPQTDVDKAFAERLAMLPPVVQQAIQSADLEKRLRSLANTHKLHIDQWELLENEVKLALLGFTEVEKLPENLEKEVGVDHETAIHLTQAINDEIFEPIREELERGLEHPMAPAVQNDAIEQVRQDALAHAAQADETATLPPPTPPTPAPEGKVMRAPLSETYKPSIPSSERKAVEGDPYREPPL